jgi:hypothetical protein
MRKTTTFKLLMALAIATASVFGLFHATAQPAYALHCPHQLVGPGGGCTFTGTQHFGGYICCMYACTGGQTLEGPCEICP